MKQGQVHHLTLFGAKAKPCREDFFLEGVLMLSQPVAALFQWWQGLLSDLSKSPRGPRFRPILWVVLPLCLLIGVTLIVRITNFDYSFQKAIYSAGGNSWALGDHPLWTTLYRYGTLMPTVVVFGSLIGLILGFSRESFRRWRKVFLFSMLLFLTGPGVITNGLLKEYWGRPRPREVEELGGYEKFEPILSIDRESTGKSFPCGHATMGFYFLGGFFLFRRYRRRLAEGFLLFGLLSGGLIGIARIAQGGHFFSDVIWAAAVCYFTALGLFYLMRLDRGLAQTSDTGKSMTKFAKFGVTLLILILLGCIAIATPYRAERNITLLNDYAKEGDLSFRLVFALGRVDIRPGDHFEITGEAYGHGVPTSQIASHYVEYDRESYTRIVYDERISGWFSEVHETLEIRIPWDRTVEIWLQPREAEISLTLPLGSPNVRIHLMNGPGKISIDANQQEIVLGKQPGENTSGVRITRDNNFTGELFIDEELVSFDQLRE